MLTCVCVYLVGIPEFLGYLFWCFYVFHQFWKFLGLYPLKKILAHFKFLLLLGFSLQTVWYYPIGLKEKAMATHSSTLAWKIPRAKEPGRLQSMGSWRVGHDWATSLSLFTFMHWRRKRQPTPVFFAWRIPGTGEPGGLPSMGSHRVGHDRSDLAGAAAT